MFCFEIPKERFPTLGLKTSNITSYYYSPSLFFFSLYFRKIEGKVGKGEKEKVDRRDEIGESSLGVFYRNA